MSSPVIRIPEPRLNRSFILLIYHKLPLYNRYKRVSVRSVTFCLQNGGAAAVETTDRSPGITVSIANAAPAADERYSSISASQTEDNLLRLMMEPIVSLTYSHKIPPVPKQRALISALVA